MTTEKHSTLTDSIEPRQNESLWDTGDLAAYLGVSRQTARKYVETMGVPFIPLPRGVRYDPEAVREWAKGREVTKAA